MNAYSWSCLACEASNPADRTRCDRCGCPAHATLSQVDEARQAWRRRSGLPAPAGFDLIGTLRALPLLPIGAAVLGLLGGGALLVSVSASYGTLGAFGGLLLALAALCLSSYRSPA